MTVVMPEVGNALENWIGRANGLTLTG